MATRNANPRAGDAGAGTRQETSTASTHKPNRPSKQDRPRFLLELRAEPDAISPVHRLRAALKVLGRRFHFTCTSIEEVRQ
jgi:hypothetical protein